MSRIGEIMKGGEDMIIIALIVLVVCCSLLYALRENDKFDKTPEGAQELEYQRRFNKTLAEAQAREAQRPVTCPKCHSTQITGSITKSTFSVGKAVAGGVLLGGVGTLAGFAGNKQASLMCMKCGHVWKP